MNTPIKTYHQIQHKVRPEVKRWIESRARELDRSQVWLVNRIVPVGEHLNAARAMAQRLAQNSPMVLRLFKRFAADVLPKGPVEKSVAAFRELDVLANSADFQEGLAALREERPPVFQGK